MPGRAIAIVFLFNLIAPVCLSGQTGRATITGTVDDSSGRVVPSAVIEAVNLDTGIVNSALTSGAGIYAMVNLPAGRYSVTFSKDGFKPVEFSSVALHVDQVAQLNVSMAVGLQTNTINVSDAIPLLDKETSAIGTNMKGNDVSELPLNIYGGRAIESFAVAITPGYSPLSSPYNAVINGTQTFTKDFTVDGTSATAQIQGDSFEIGPSMEAVEEMQAETSGLSAQNGITNGGVVMFNLKSGSNEFHGSAFTFGHNERLDANTFDNNRLGVAKPKARFWDWGFSAGGPVRKNKTFIFGAIERFSQNDFTLGGFGGASTVPTSEFLKGNFSALLGGPLTNGSGDPYVNPCTGQPVLSGQLFNPATSRSVNGVTCADPFAGNIIAPAMFSSVAQKVIAIYQRDYAPQVSGLLQNDQTPKSNSPSQNPIQIDIKVDHSFSRQNRFSSSWIYNHRPRTLVDSGGLWANGSTDGGPLANARDQLVYAHEFRATDSHAFRQNFLNVLNFTYNWYWNGSVPTAAGTNWPAALGFGDTGAGNFPAINFGTAVNGIYETSIGNSWQGHYVGATAIIGDAISWSKGRHTLSFGGDYRAMQINSHAGSGALNFSFSNNATGAPAQPYAGKVGFGFASFLLGQVQSASASTPLNLYGRRKATSLFIQDNYKMTPRLTLNMGLRWDMNFQFHEKDGHWANFDLNTIDPNLGIPGAIVYARNGGDSFEKYRDWKDFAPEFGFAYSPSDRLVIRGSWGMTNVPIGIQYFAGVPYGFAPGFRGSNTSAGPFNWDQGYPGKFTPGTLSSTPDPSLFPIATVDPHALTSGYTENWNLGAQYAVTRTVKVEAGYIANRGHHLQGSNLAYNEASPGRFMDLVKSGNASVPVCDPYTAASINVPYPFAGFCGPAFAAIAPFPQLAQGAAYYVGYPNLYYVGLPLGQSSYDSMMIELTKHTGQNLSMNFSYTLSRQRGDTFDNFGDSYEVALNGIQDLSNLKEAAHTLSPYDQEHVVKGYLTYRLPFGKGRKWIAANGRAANALVSGWTASGLVTYASGAPLSFYSPNIYNYYPGWGAVYVNYQLGGYGGSQFQSANFTPATDSNPTPVGSQYFPASIVSNPADGQLGSGPSRIDAVRGFGIRNEDVSLAKNFRFGTDGRFDLSVRIEFYNALNRTNFANPNTSVGSPQFGYVTGAKSTSRQGQFGARFQW